MTTVFIAAPTPMMRAGLRAMLDTGSLQVIGEAASLAEAGEELSSTDVLIIADEDLLGDALRIVTGNGETAVVVLSESDSPAAMLREMSLRGWGIVPPDTPAAELQAAILSAAQGLVVLSVPLAERLLQGRRAVQALDNKTLEEELTAREREVLELLSQGLSNKLIAQKLNISEHTVKFHVSSLYTKLGAASRTDAVSRGARLGLISF
jgi:DNA-binding NarL/FixJ family response regulator